MLTYISVFFLIIILILLVALILRFFLPQLIYDLRRAYAGVESKKAFLDARNGRENVSPRFKSALVSDIRYDSPSTDNTYIKKRVLKIKELYTTLDPHRDNPIKIHEKNFQVCIIELANMLEKLGKEMQPTSDFAYTIVDSNSILTYIANEISNSEKFTPISTNLASPIDKETEIENWYLEHPISMEQAIELLCAAAHTLACRKEKTKND